MSNIIYHFFYKTINTITNKYYYGRHSTSDMNDGYIGSGKALKYSISKYGKENFICTPLKFFDNLKDLIAFEEKFLNIFNLAEDNNSYNISNSGLGTLKGYKLSKETKAKMSKSRTGVKQSPETIEKKRKSNIGKHHGKRSTDTKMKMSKARKGKKFTEEHKSKLSIARYKYLERIKTNIDS